MSVVITYDLSDEEKGAVLETMAILNVSGEAESFLQSIHAGQREIDQMIEQAKSRRAAKLSNAVPALIRAGIDPDLIVSLAEAYAAASPGVRAEVEKRLLG